MHRKLPGCRREGDAYLVTARPAATTLISPMFRAPVTDSMWWLLAAAVPLFIFIQHPPLEQAVLPAVMFGALAVTAVLNGCRAGQDDLHEHRRQPMQQLRQHTVRNRNSNSRQSSAQALPGDRNERTARCGAPAVRLPEPAGEITRKISCRAAGTLFRLRLVIQQHRRKFENQSACPGIL